MVVRVVSVGVVSDRWVYSWSRVSGRSWRGLVAGLICMVLGLVGGNEMFWFRTTTIVSLVAACAWWVCWPSASSGQRLGEEGGLAASNIGIEDRVYANLYERAVADEYVQEALGNFKAEGRENKVVWAAVYCRKKDTTSELERNNGNAEMGNYIRGMKFAICMGHVLPVVP